MKIGILTLPLKHNFGGILQAYALQETLKTLGHDVSVIHRSGIDYPVWRQVLGGIKRAVLAKGHSAKAKKDPRVERLVYGKLLKFIDENIQRTEEYRGKRSLDHLADEGFEAIVVGSDQVWRKAYCPWIFNYFGDFDREHRMKLVSYAASFGLGEWQYDWWETRRCSRLAKHFRAISVREISAVETCQKYLGVTARICVDPTMLLSAEDYVTLAESSEVQVEGGVSIYLFDRSTALAKIADEVAASLNMKANSILPDHVSSDSNIDSVGEQYVNMSPYAWIEHFRKADYIVTDSFHGTLFSIIFEKPFVTFSNKSRGTARFNPSLSQFGLMDRLITGDPSVEEAAEVLRKPIDWSKVRDIRAEVRQQGLDYLGNSLGN